MKIVRIIANAVALTLFLLSFLVIFPKTRGAGLSDVNVDADSALVCRIILLVAGAISVGVMVEGLVKLQRIGLGSLIFVAALTRYITLSLFIW